MEFKNHNFSAMRENVSKLLQPFRNKNIGYKNITDKLQKIMFPVRNKEFLLTFISDKIKKTLEKMQKLWYYKPDALCNVFTD